MSTRPFFILIALVALVGCQPQRPLPPPRTQLEIRQIQTREYRNVNSTLVMKALLNTLQDDGFIVRNAVTELGLITATKDLEVERVPVSPWSGAVFGGFGSSPGGFGLGMGPGYYDDYAASRRQTVIEASANVTEIRGFTRVRVNFQKKTSDGRGGTIEVLPLDDDSYYQDFFEKVDKGIFLQRENL